MSTIIGLDFETFSGCDLLKHGLHQYVNDPTFMPLIAAVAHPDMSVDLFDFTEDLEGESERLFKMLDGKTIAAHNAGFEQAVLERMGIDIPSSQFIDSAVCARAAGAAGKLEAAAPQLLGLDKLSMGYDLIKLFSIPGPYQEKSGDNSFVHQIVVDNLDKWADFAHYCAVDAQLSLRLATEFPLTNRERDFNAVTMDMNNVGWHVDMDMVREMQQRYLANIRAAEAQFRADCDEQDLNLNSTMQLKAWCAKRGVRATSFDEKHVASLLKAVERKLASTKPDDFRYAEYLQVKHMLETKQTLGGSSLKKLDTIINTIGTDGRLHDQYLHVGAGATFRTTGRGVQMQNLKRLGENADDVLELLEGSVEWDNDKMARNLRQVFTASHPQGQLIVGDFSSVESRGLAWQAGEDWKLDAYFAGEDLYKVQAGVMFGKPADQVVKSERQIGKVAELACGYGAGSDAVREFASKMGVVLSEGESAKLVSDWRDANPRIVTYWYALDAALHSAVMSRAPQYVPIKHGKVAIVPMDSPESLRKQDPAAGVSLSIQLWLADGTCLLTRVIHGCRLVGRNIQYYKPSERKTGDLWSDEFVNPKTKRLQKYTVYGGKLAGLLTQSMCREVFMDVALTVSTHLPPNVQLIGQFHDELVLEWQPGRLSLEYTIEDTKRAMSSTKLPRFPLAAEVKSDFRYIK